MSEQLLTPQQAAEILTISVKLLRAHVKAGDIAFIAKGTGVKRRKMAFDPADVQEFIDRRRTRKCQSSNMPKAPIGKSNSISTVIPFEALQRPKARKRQRP
ncbi:helix-turn-helix domain-containing protein [Rhizobium leguminosarum]|uniref:helix-turn-helix domain-containing protein n=1 Tax=Rhizobium leguminosarum TaxID=384 RepID=UPI001C98DD5B|nr:helix-turn-helix domain-containing protein [Rhizobium leguminosarum]MBY5689379.1 helix-turn-helix domain-containing protein [Rhizobium leguminosarum]